MKDQRSNWVFSWKLFRLPGQRLYCFKSALGVSGQDIRRKTSCWLVNQHWGWWRTLGNTQRHARELISENSLGTKTRFLSFNLTQSRVVTGLFTWHNTLRRHLYSIGLSGSPFCRFGADDDTSVWSSGFAQTCAFGLLFLRASGY
jgi:hypothetical protein